jgi:DNA polymerase (family 10)
MDREDIADVLDQIALLLELKGENIFKTRAYRNGAEIVRSNDADIVALAKENKLDGIAGLGKALQQKIHELATTGKLEFYENLRAEFPPTLLIFLKFKVLDLKRSKPSTINSKLIRSSHSKLPAKVALLAH